jgi:hypothetical protein
MSPNLLKSRWLVTRTSYKAVGDSIKTRNSRYKWEYSPSTQIQTVHKWENVRTKSLLQEVKCHRATNERLNIVHLQHSDQCPSQKIEHTTQTHRMRRSIINFELNRNLAAIQRTDEKHIESEWLTFPTFKLWPKPNHNASVWLVASAIHYAVTSYNKVRAEDCLCYMRRTRWKVYTWKKKKRRRIFDNYLKVCWSEKEGLRRRQRSR